MNYDYMHILFQTIMGGLIGYIFMAVNEMRIKINKAVDLETVEKMIEQENAVLEERTGTLKDLVGRLEEKLDMVLEKLLER